MRSDTRFDDTAPSFTLVCSGYRGGKATGKEASARRNLTFTIGSEVVAEIAHKDLLESWEAAKDLSPSEAQKMTEIAAAHLTDLLASGLPPEELTDAVTDAAVVFLLALKRNGVDSPKRIPACTVMWNGHEGKERVYFEA